MMRWALMVGLGLAMGCGDGGPGTDTRQTCAQMGFRCGFDDYGASCGTCTSPQTCNGFGSCSSSSSGCTCSGAVCGNDSCGRAVCGSCTGGRTCTLGVCTASTTTPTSHDLGAARLPLFTGFRGVTFTVPAARAAYSVSSPGDTYNVGIFTAAEWSNYSAGGQARAFAFRENVRTATEVADLPAGSYVLGFYCRNLIQRCDVTYALNANY